MSSRLDDEDLLGEALSELGLKNIELAGDLGLVVALETADVALRSRVMSTAAETHRFEDLESNIAELLDLSDEQVRPMLLLVDEARSWEPGPRPGVELFHVSGGPAVRDAVTGFVRIQPGLEFPEHEHLGDETVMVLQGLIVDDSGAKHGRGAILRMPAGTRHTTPMAGRIPLVYLAIIQKAVVIDGVILGPLDPRG